MKDAPDWTRNAYRLRLELEYRRCHGTSFQELFNQVMRSIHGADFVETVALGREGDLGCDGYLKSRRATFAVYGPSPYFHLNEARAKMRADFKRLLDCWSPVEVDAWQFVVNYPGVHPSLLKLAGELERDANDIKVHVWSRYDLTQQFLLYSNREHVRVEFGDVEAGSKILAPLSFVPEDTALPSSQAQLAHRRLWARLTCNKHELEKLDQTWLMSLTTHPWENLLSHTQLLLGAMASGTMEGAFDPATLAIGTLQREAGLQKRAARKDVEAAWAFPMVILMQEDSQFEVPKLSGDSEEATLQVGSICMIQERLTLALIRMQARTLGQWETDILDDVWRYATDEIKIHR